MLPDRVIVIALGFYQDLRLSKSKEHFLRLRLGAQRVVESILFAQD